MKISEISEISVDNQIIINMQDKDDPERIYSFEKITETYSTLATALSSLTTSQNLFNRVIALQMKRNIKSGIDSYIRVAKRHINANWMDKKDPELIKNKREIKLLTLKIVTNN
jgi:hypothetical protein